MSYKFKNEYGFMFTTSLIALMAMPAQAQIEPDDEIIVTAQRREQTLQDVPLSVTVIPEAVLERSQISTAEDLVSLSPGVDGTSVAATTPRINIRGVSTEDFGVGSDPALGFYVDGVYLGRGVSSLNDIFDLDRVEIAKGPQGTLYGRNTTAGAINFITNKPVIGEEAFSASVAAGNYDYLRGRATANIPVSENFALRVAGTYRQRDGYVDNTLGGDALGAERTQAIRVSGLYSGERVEVLLSGESRSTRNGAQPYISVPLVGTDVFGDATTDLGGDGRDEIDSYRVFADITADLGALELQSITSFTGFGDQSYLEDTDASPLTLLHFGTDGKEDTISQEFRLSGANDRIDWFAGVSGAWTDTRSTQSANFAEDSWCLVLAGDSCLNAFGFNGEPLVTESSVASGDFTNYAVFGDVIFSVTDRLDVTVGARYSRTEKDFDLAFPANANLLGPIILTPPSRADLEAFGTVSTDGVLQRNESWEDFQPRFVVAYDVAQNLNVYASATKGFKSGGFNQLNLGPAFDEETIWSYEVGAKGRLGSTLRYDLAAYYYEYDDLQVLIQLPGLPAPITQNAAQSQAIGLEAQADWTPVDSLTLSGGLSVQDAEYDAFQRDAATDLSGNRLVRTPDFSATFVADYSAPLMGQEAFLRGEYSYRDNVFFTPENTEFASQDGFSLVNASAGVVLNDRIRIVAFARNLLDKDYLVDAQTVVPELIQYTQRGEPRTYGVEVGVDF